MPCAKLLDFLTDHGVDFRLVEHPSAFAAQDVAFKAGVKRRMFAKTVMVKLDGRMAMAVLPADSRIDFHLLREAARAETVTLCLEAEFAEIFPDCELGAMPPFGNLYEMPVYVSGNLIRAESISFNAGTHTEIITMPYQDFARLADPQIGFFSYRRPLARKGMA